MNSVLAALAFASGFGFGLLIGVVISLHIMKKKIKEMNPVSGGGADVDDMMAEAEDMMGDLMGGFEEDVDED